MRVPQKPTERGPAATRGEAMADFKAALRVLSQRGGQPCVKENYPGISARTSRLKLSPRDFKGQNTDEPDQLSPDRQIRLATHGRSIQMCLNRTHALHRFWAAYLGVIVSQKLPISCEFISLFCNSPPPKQRVALWIVDRHKYHKTFARMIS